ncbi:MAG: hypothetical protein M3442_03885 [Chloroflexota bacterium]|nr:hypothetical protein [Chloroflexota bacterium]
MTKQPTPIDYSTATPELQRLAEEVRHSKQPRFIQKEGETIAVVMPVASKRTRRQPKAEADVDVTTGNVTTDGTTMERVETTLSLPPPPPPAEIARRQALERRILASQPLRVIAPVTSADLVREVREEASRSHDDRR